MGFRCRGIYPENLWKSKNLLKLQGRVMSMLLREYFLFFLNLKFSEGRTKGTLSMETSRVTISWVLTLMH